MSVPHHGPKRGRVAPRRRAQSWRHDWDFWRFVIATLGLVWEVVKTLLK